MASKGREAATKAADGEEGTTTFNARLPKRLKRTLQRAAELRGQTLSDFVMSSAYDRAIATISDEKLLRLSDRDSQKFALALIEPASMDRDVLERFKTAHKRSQSRP